MLSLLSIFATVWGAEAAWQSCPPLTIESNDCSQSLYIRVKFGAQSRELVDPFDEPVSNPHSLRMMLGSGLSHYVSYSRSFFTEDQGCIPSPDLPVEETWTKTASLARSLMCPARSSNLGSSSSCFNGEMATDHIPNVGRNGESLSRNAVMLARLDPPNCPVAPCRFVIEMCAQTNCTIEWLRGIELGMVMCAGVNLVPSWLLLLGPLLLSILW